MSIPANGVPAKDIPAHSNGPVKAPKKTTRKKAEPEAVVEEVPAAEEATPSEE